MRRKPLSAKVRRGIRALLGLAFASPSDFIGHNLDSWDKQEKKDWSDVEAVQAWIDSVEAPKEPF